MEGGYDITQWPVAVPARTGELAQSWLVRIGQRYAIPPAAVLHAADPAGRGRGPTDARNQPLLDAVGALVRTSWQPTTRSASEEAIRSWSTRYGRRGSPSAGVSFCPACLDEPDPFWRAEWASPLHLVCARHGLALVSACPRCRQRPFTSTSWRQRPAPVWTCPSRLPDVTRTARTHRDWCDHDLRRAPAARAVDHDLEGALHAQAALDAAALAAEDCVRLPVSDWQVTTVQYADALLELIDEQVLAHRWSTTPSDTLQAAVAVAVQILTAPSMQDVERIAAAHGALDPTGDHTPIRPVRRHYHPRSPVLMALRLGSLAQHLSLGDRLMFRTASAQPRPPARTETVIAARRVIEGAWPARGWVPPLLWDGVLTEHSVGRGTCARAALSLALSKVGSNAPMRAIAVDLGLPGWLADRIATVLCRGTRAERDVLVAGLEQLYTRLEADPPPIDYSERVETGRDLEAFRDAAVDAAGVQGVVLHEPTETTLTAQLWATYTGSDARFCPLLDGREATPCWPAELDVEDFLTMAHQQLPHYTGEPLVWVPP